MNLSDLAAMGAAPLGYLLALARAKETSDDWLAEFCAGLAPTMRPSGSRFWAATPWRRPARSPCRSPRSARCPRARRLRRGAAPGDDVWVSGTLGDGALGLKVLQGELEVANDARAYLIERYRLPRPRLALGQALRGIASAAIDVSDGLVADLGHILEVSGVGAELHADTLPLSDAARDLPGARDAALSGGDDYELLFTAPPQRRADIAALARRLDLPLTRIGAIRAEPGLHVLDEKGQEPFLPTASRMAARLKRPWRAIGGASIGGSSDMSIVGRIESLWRYPVKSMRGEELDEAFVGFSGVYGDRLFAFKKYRLP